MNRLDCFNVAAARILQKLLEAFPQPVVLDAEAIQEELAQDHVDCAIRGGPGNPGSLVSWSIHFLVEEGYIRTSQAVDVQTRVFPRCVLTVKGFAALNRKIESLEPGKTLGARLIDAGRVIAPEAASALIGHILG